MLLPGPTISAAPLLLSFEPAGQTQSVGNVFAVDVVIGGLDPADGTELVSAFDLDIVFDPGILEVTSVTFGTSLGSDFDQFSDASVVGGVLDVVQFSFLTDLALDALQPGTSVTLLTIGLRGLHAGTSPLALDTTTQYVAGGLDFTDDPQGIASILDVGVRDGGVTIDSRINGVPAPGTFWLVAAGLAALGWRRKSGSPAARTAKMRRPVHALAFTVVFTAALPAWAQTPLACDANGDNFIDRLDIDLINAARNQLASGPTDPRDADRDGRITVNDTRTCTQRCGLVNCATRSNAAPKVNAGAAQTVALSYGPRPFASVDLKAIVTDDGLPAPPAKVTLAWSRLSGPGTVSFVAPDAASTRVYMENAGTYVLRLSASDGAATTTGDVTVNVVGPRPATPTLKPIANRTIPLGSRLDLLLAVDEPNAFDVLTYSMPAAPAGARFNPPRAIEWTPTSAQLGIHTFTLQVRNSAGASDTKSFQVTVVSANRPPVLDALSDAAAFVGAPFSRTLNATDPDAGDVLTYALLSGPAGMSLAGGRTLAWTPAATQVGEHLVTVAVTDRTGASAVARFALTVRSAAKPVARDDHFTVQLGGALAVGAPGVLVNDADPNGGVLTASKRSDPDKGVLQSFGTDGRFLYRAPAALPPRPPLQSALRWHADPGFFSYAMAIGDLDGDGKPDVVHLAQNNHVRALRGSDGSVLWARNGLPPPYNNCTPFLGDDNEPVIADIDDDGRADIVVHVGCNNDSPSAGFFGHTRVIALNGRDGSVKWLSPRLVTGYDPAMQGPPRTITEAVTLTVARLSPGESPSILGGHTIEDFTATNGCAHVPGGSTAHKRCRYVFALDGRNGSLRRSFYSAPSDQALPRMNYDSPGLGGVGRFESPIVLDFDGDGTLEVLFEGSLWSATGALLRQFDGDRARPNSSRAAVADLDGDGRIDVVLLDQQLGRARTYAIDGTLLWDVSAPHCKVGGNAFCALSVADVDADGQPEILIGGRDRLVVHDRFGRVKWASVDPNRSVENRLGCDNRPAVYDLDGDGVPEVIVRDAYIVKFLRGTTGEEVTRFNFGPTNSGYLCNVPQEVRVVDIDGDGAADVVFNAPYDGISGLNFGGIWVLKSANDPWMPARRLFNAWGYVTTLFNDDVTVPATYIRPSASAATNLFAQQRQLATRPDLRMREHTAFTYAATSQGIASDAATVAIDLVPPNRPPVITSIPPVAGPTTNFMYQLTATDPDSGDRLTWSLVYADFLSFDTAAAIDPASGLLTKARSNPAGYLFIVRVTDSQGAFAEQAITVDLTSATSSVPLLIGRSQAAALSLLAGSNLVGGASVEQYDAAPAGQVLGQAPGSGAVVPRGSAVQLTVSKGPAPQIVPSVLGRSVASTASALAGAGFRVGTVTYAYNDRVARGEVVSQTPAPGREVVPGAVDIVVSGGSGLAVVLTREVVTAGGSLTAMLEATTPAGDLAPTPPVTLSLVRVGEAQGALPSLNGATIATDVTTRGTFEVIAAEIGGGGRVASARFAVLNASSVGAPTQHLHYAAFADALANMSDLAEALDHARLAGDVPKMRALLAQIVATWKSAVDVDKLSRTVPLAPSEGFLPKLAELPAAGLAPTPDDGLIVPAMEDIVDKLRALREVLDDDPGSVAAYRAAVAALEPSISAFARIEPSPYGVLAANGAYAAVLANLLPKTLDRWMLAVDKALPNLAASKAVAKFGLPITLAEVAEATSIQVLLAKKLYMPAIKHVAYSAAALALHKLLHTYLNGGGLNGIITGSSLSFHVFNAQYSTIEVNGADPRHPENVSVLIIGPSVITAVTDLKDQIVGLKDVVSNTGDVLQKARNFDDVWKHAENIRDTLGKAIDQGFKSYNAFDPTNFQADKSFAGCVLTTEPDCASLVYKRGFEPVHTCAQGELCLPAPVLFIVWGRIEGGVGIDTFVFLPAPAPSE